MKENLIITTVTGRTLNCSEKVSISEILSEKDKKVQPTVMPNTQTKIKGAEAVKNYKFKEQFPGTSEQDLKKIIFDFMINSDYHKIYVQVFEKAHGKNIINNWIVDPKVVETPCYKMGVTTIKSILAKQKEIGIALPILLLRLKKFEELKKAQKQIQTDLLNENNKSESRQLSKQK